jgi:hypothetical protein
MLMTSGASSGALTYALPAHSATSTKAIGTASWVTTASRSRRAQHARLLKSAPKRRQYSTGPASRPGADSVYQTQHDHPTKLCVAGQVYACWQEFS